MSNPYNPYLGSLRSRYNDYYDRTLERGMGQFSNSNLPDLQIRVIEERAGMLTIVAYDSSTNRRSQMEYFIKKDLSPLLPIPPKQNLMLLLI
jgi:hypothetical protein